MTFEPFHLREKLLSVTKQNLCPHLFQETTFKIDRGHVVQPREIEKKFVEVKTRAAVTKRSRLGLKKSLLWNTNDPRGRPAPSYSRYFPRQIYLQTRNGSPCTIPKALFTNTVNELAAREFFGLQQFPPRILHGLASTGLCGIIQNDLQAMLRVAPARVIINSFRLLLERWCRNAQF